MRTTFWHRVRVLVTVLRYWGRCPYLRLGQLLLNAVDASGGKLHFPAAHPGVFYRADEGLLQDLWIYDLKQRGLLKW